VPLRADFANLAMALRSSACLSSIAVAIGSLFGFDISRAEITNTTPTSGNSVFVNNAPPNPDPRGIAAVPGSMNVTVLFDFLLPPEAAGIAVIDINGILIRNDSEVFSSTSGLITVQGDNVDAIRAGGNLNTVLYGGTITTAGDSSNGIAAIGDGNTLTNSGSITTSGDAAHGLFADGVGNTLINNGTINVSGAGAHGINSLGTGLGPITNSGTITAAGPGGLGAFIGGPATFTHSNGLDHEPAGVRRHCQWRGNDQQCRYDHRPAHRHH
jgi:hypothetical protein